MFISRLLPKMPTVDELVAYALTSTDFVIETPAGLSDRETLRSATICAADAVEVWEAEADLPIGLTVPDAIRHAVAVLLIKHAEARHAAQAVYDELAIADGIAAGDIDCNGEYIPQTPYWSA